MLNTTWGGINLLDGSFSKASELFSNWGLTMVIILSVTIGFVHATIAAATAQGTLGLNGAVSTQTTAGNYISTIDAAISIISTRRGALGSSIKQTR